MLNQQSILKAFITKYEKRIELRLTVLGKYIDFEGDVHVHSTIIKEWIEIEDIIINGNRRLVAFNIKVQNLYNLRLEYGDLNGNPNWNIREALVSRFHTFLNTYLGNPKVVVYITNEI
jgi:hypothetical protein